MTTDKSTPQSQPLAWCERNHATVWWGKHDVRVKVSDFPGTTRGATLQEAISSIEQKRLERLWIREALKSLNEMGAIT